MVKIALVAGVALVGSAVSAMAVAGSGDGGPDIGVPDDVDLQLSSNVRVTEDGAVVDALDVRGYIYVTANDVTIRNTNVRSGGPHAIRLGRGYSGLVVENSTLTCTKRAGRAGIAWGNYTAANVEVGERCKHGFLHNDNSSITASYWAGEPFPDVNAESAPTTTTAPGQVDGGPWTPPPTTAPPTTAAPTTTTPPTTAAPPPTTTPPSSGGGSGGFPTAADTGVPDGTALRDSGSITITEPGKVIDGLNITGMVTVDAPDVTIRNTHITATGDRGIRVVSGHPVIEDTTIVGGHDGCEEAIGFGNYDAIRVDLSGCKDGLKINGNVTLRDSYIHDLLEVSGAHNDGAQAMSGSNMVLEGNTICAQYQSTVSAIKLTPEFGPINEVTIRDNFLYGGGYTLYMDSKPNTYGLVTNTLVENNVIDPTAYRFGDMTIDAHPTQRLVGNVASQVTALFGSNPCD